MAPRERALDSLSWRAAEAMGRVGEALRRRARSLRPRRTIDALRVALEGGGYETARRLAREIQPRLGEMGETRRREILPLVLTTLLSHGERLEAMELASLHRSDLERTARGVGLLATLGDEDALARVVLPGGRLHAYALSRGVEEGRIDADALVSMFLAHREAVVRRPDLHLLVHGACRYRDPVRARAGLDRFLRAYGLPRCAAVPDPDVVRSVRFRSSPPRSGPLVSVLVPAFRAASTVEYAVDSLLSQTWRNIEVLVCDDASDDDTLGILRRRYGSHPHVRLFESRSNQGAYNVRNALLERARGELVAFHDADDLALPTRIEAQVRPIGRGATACYACGVRVTPDGRFVFFPDQSAVRFFRAALVASRAALGPAPFRSARFGADLELEEALRRQHGTAKVAILRTPLVLALWSQGSATLQSGSESHEDGYRSPARRDYAEWVFRRSSGSASDADVDRALRAADNWCEPAEIVEVR